MAEIKISALLAATAIDGTEVVPVVQAGTTKRSDVAAIHALHTGAADPHPGYLLESAAATLGVNVRTLSATPDAVTDWGALLNTALAAGTRRFVFPGTGDYPFTTTINARDLQGVTFEGENGVQWPLEGGTPTVDDEVSSRLIWKGTGSGIAIDAGGSSGFTLQDMGVYYDNAGFTGHLIDLGATTGSVVSALARIDRCHLGSRLRAHRTAESIVNINEAICATISRSTIGGARFPIKGGPTNSNANRIIDCTLHRGAVALIGNPFNQWTIDNCIFELEDTPAVLDTDWAADTTSQFTFSNNWVGDETGSGRPWFRQRRNAYWEATFTGNALHGVTGPLFDLQGGGSVRIVNNPRVHVNDLALLVDLGNRTTLVAPTSPSATAVASGGTFAAGTYFWKVTAINGSQESVGSTEVSATIVANGRATITWATVAGARGYRVYRSSTSGGQSTSPALVATLGDVLTYNDTGTAPTAGAVPATGTPAAIQKKSFTFTGNTGTSNVGGESIINRTGHRNLNIYGNSVDIGTLELRTLGGHERAGFPDNQTAPTIAAGPALGSGGTVAITGTDLAGQININHGTGATAGRLCVVTFGKPYVPDGNAPLQRALVQITPGWGAEAATIGAYTDPSFLGLTQFALAVANTPSSNGATNFYYRVITI